MRIARCPEPAGAEPPRMDAEGASPRPAGVAPAAVVARMARLFMGRVSGLSGLKGSSRGRPICLFPRLRIRSTGAKTAPRRFSSRSRRTQRSALQHDRPSFLWRATLRRRRTYNNRFAFRPHPGGHGGPPSSKTVLLHDTTGRISREAGRSPWWTVWCAVTNVVEGRGRSRSRPRRFPPGGDAT